MDNELNVLTTLEKEESTEVAIENEISDGINIDTPIEVSEDEVKTNVEETETTEEDSAVESETEEAPESEEKSEEEEFLSHFISYELTDEDKEEITKEFEDIDLQNMRFSDVVVLSQKYSRSLNELNNSAATIVEYDEMLKMCDSIQESIESAAIEDVNENIRMPNPDEMLENDQKEELESFRSSFIMNKKKVEFAISIISNRISDFKEDTKSTKFLNDELKYSMEKSKTNIENNKDKLLPKFYARQIKRVDLCLDAIDNRTEITYILTKFNSENPKFVKHIKKAAGQKDRFDRAVNKMSKTLGRNDVPTIVEVIKNRYNDEEYATAFIDYTTEMLKSSLGVGQFMYWKLMLINIVAISADQFDLEISGEEYMNKLDALHEEYKKVIS